VAQSLGDGRPDRADGRLKPGKPINPAVVTTKSRALQGN